MALFSSYTAPGVTTSEQIANPGVALQSGIRVPVFIGEGEENQLFSNVETHRGSSSVADDWVVNENLTDQMYDISGNWLGTLQFTTTYGPIVTGDGTGTVSNTPTDIKVTVDGIPATVSTLNGLTRTFLLSILPVKGQTVEVTYYFKRTDTLISNEDLSNQIPTFATLAIYPLPLTGFGRSNPNITFSLTQPGELGNLVSVALTITANNGKTDEGAVTVSGNAVSIEVVKADANGTLRTYAEIQALISTLGGVPTSEGNLIVTQAVSNTLADALTPTFLSGGAGPSSNTIFKVAHVPIVDGTNGGVVTNNPNYVIAYIGSVATPILSVDGLNGLVTLQNPVSAGSKLSITYYTNTYQDTFDLLPAANIVQINQVGYGPDRSDFIDGVDYVLETITNPDGTVSSTRIQWGASASINSGVLTPGYVPFDGSVITTTLIDEKRFLQLCLSPSGSNPTTNSTFILPDVPTDGSGQSRVTNDPSMIEVYIGTNPETALAAGGPVNVVQLYGATGTFQLYNPPVSGSNVYATYYRNTLNDHTYTLTVNTPGITGSGNYTIIDENSNTLPLISFNSATTSVTEANFKTTGIVWPNSISDMRGVAGATPNGDLSIQFISDSSPSEIIPAVSATATVDGLIFTAPPGLAGNSLTVSITVGAPSISINVSAISVSGNTLADILGLTGTQCTITLAPGHSSTETVVATTNPVSLTGGADPQTIAVSSSFNVILNGDIIGSVGHLNQTFFDPVTGISFTIINPSDATLFGYQSNPSPSYHFRPLDILDFTISSSPFTTSSVPTFAIPGLMTKVGTTFGMRQSDTAIIHTYNKAGNEPAIGDFYYITYTTAKTDADMALTLYSNPADAYNAYGAPNPINKLSLAAQLFTDNGGQIFGCLQVRKATGLNTASDTTYQAAIASLASPLPGSDSKADIIQVLTTSPVVLQYLNKFLITQAAPRNKGEATSVMGFGFNTDPTSMRTLARSMKSDRSIQIGAPGVTLTVSTDGSDVQYAVGGEFLAAAMAGMILDPSNDVATTLTRQSMVGFDNLITRFDDPTMDLMAADGLTCLIERDGALVVRHWVTTDNTSVLKREPTSRLVIDMVRKTMRSNLEQFIGRKFIQSAINSVTIVAASTLKAMMDAELIEGFSNLVVTRDAVDPTTLHVAFAVKPVFSLLYISVEITVTTQL